MNIILYYTLYYKNEGHYFQWSVTGRASIYFWYVFFFCGSDKAFFDNLFVSDEMCVCLSVCWRFPYPIPILAFVESLSKSYYSLPVSRTWKEHKEGDLVKKKRNVVKVQKKV